MNQQTKKKQQGWKVAFLLLLFLNIFLFAWLVRSLTATADYMAPTAPESAEMANGLTATTTIGSGDLELLLQKALKRYEGVEELAIRVSDMVELEGRFSLLGLDVPYLVRGEPFVTEAGDLQIKVDSIYLGSLSLPNQQVLSLISSQLEPSLPLTVNSAEEWLVIHLTHYQSENGLTVRLLQIAKDTQEYTFELALPKENLLQ